MINVQYDRRKQEMKDVSGAMRSIKSSTHFSAYKNRHSVSPINTANNKKRNRVRSGIMLQRCEVPYC